MWYLCGALIWLLWLHKQLLFKVRTFPKFSCWDEWKQIHLSAALPLLSGLRRKSQPDNSHRNWKGYDMLIWFAFSPRVSGNKSKHTFFPQLEVGSCSQNNATKTLALVDFNVKSPFRATESKISSSIDSFTMWITLLVHCIITVEGRKIGPCTYLVWRILP